MRKLKDGGIEERISQYKWIKTSKGDVRMATSSFVERIRVNNPKVMEEYVAAMETAANTPVEKRQEKKVKEITDPSELKTLMLKGIEKWGKK